MNSSRAKQILNSKKNISVYYKNTPVWIDEIYDNGTVSVKNLNTDKNIVVSVKTLNELS
ncbi:H-type small acid-soluble spore protein [Haloimpatiens sp. FM7330]|uniref:H-type small acid-soluble spore protein n=1 Tax=Haloimpatiens sp. FM7330 TaxID=3298610 RepID=UPI0036287E69